MERRSPTYGLWPCQALSEQRKASSVPATGGTILRSRPNFLRIVKGEVDLLIYPNAHLNI